MSEVPITRAGFDSLDEALAIVNEYYEAVDVLVRENREEFAHYYFREGSGFWLARSGPQVIGCIALRPLPYLGGIATEEPCGEIKRLYVQPAWRGRRIADALLDALHDYARSAGYHWLYLDSKPDLETAFRFYLRRGYESCTRYNDNPQATVFLRRPLWE